MWRDQPVRLPVRALLYVPGEEDPGNQPVQNAGQQQRENVEQNEIGEEVPEVVLPGQGERASLPVHQTFIVQRFDLGEDQPRTAVGKGEDPESHDDFLGPADRADYLGFHRVADRYVPLDGERRYRQRGHIDAEVLEKNEDSTANSTPYPFIPEQVVGQDLVRHRSYQCHEVRDGQTDQVAVGRGVHASGPGYDDDHHDVAQDSDNEDYPLEDSPDDLVLERVV